MSLHAHCSISCTHVLSRLACAQEQGTEVRCVPLRQLLAEAGLRHVNFFSLDVEGAELEVLKVRAASRQETPPPPRLWIVQ